MGKLNKGTNLIGTRFSSGSLQGRDKSDVEYEGGGFVCSRAWYSPCFDSKPQMYCENGDQSLLSGRRDKICIHTHTAQAQAGFDPD